jgi:hypothetical protein
MAFVYRDRENLERRRERSSIEILDISRTYIKKTPPMHTVVSRNFLL